MQVIYQRLLSGFGFDAVIGLKDGVVAKPNPTELYNLMDKFGADNQNTYFIGDGDTDVLAANNAGVNQIAVTYGYRDKEHLQKLGATVLADTPKDIQSLILR
jgi:phosphoglycolate phosphatase